jgi:hypothetical protein
VYQLGKKRQQSYEPYNVSLLLTTLGLSSPFYISVNANMDPFSVVTGIIGLIPLCAQGLNMITDCFEAPKSIKQIMVTITLQKTLFIHWGSSIGVQKISEKIPVERLKEHMPNWELIGPGILLILAEMSDIFADVKDLECSYGISLRSSKEATVRSFNLRVSAPMLTYSAIEIGEGRSPQAARSVEPQEQVQIQRPRRADEPSKEGKICTGRQRQVRKASKFALNFQ